VAASHPLQDRRGVRHADQATPESGAVLGGDLGVNNLAVTSTGTFWTGNELGYWRREYEHRRGDLQGCGTRWTHESIRSIGRKEEGRFRQTLHRIANELVQEACDHGCSVIALEDLADIRERTGASWGHKWAFTRLYEYVAYKAEGHGIGVEQVTRRARHSDTRCGGSRTQTTEGVSVLPIRSVGMRTTLTTTLRRTSGYDIFVATKPGQRRRTLGCALEQRDPNREVSLFFCRCFGQNGSPR